MRRWLKIVGFIALVVATWLAAGYALNNDRAFPLWARIALAAVIGFIWWLVACYIERDRRPQWKPRAGR